VNITAMLLTAAISALVPWLTAVVVHWQAPEGVKAAVSLLLTTVTGVLTGLQTDSHDWQHLVLYAFEGFVVATGTHFGLWKPANITGSQGAIANTFPGWFGLGSDRVVDGEVVGRR
jgi:hypothetical protein